MCSAQLWLCHAWRMPPAAASICQAPKWLPDSVERLYASPTGMLSRPVTAASWSTSAQPPAEALEHQYESASDPHTLAHTPPDPEA